MKPARPRSQWLFRAFYGATIVLGAGTLYFLLRELDFTGLPWPALILFFVFLTLADSKLASSQISGGRVLSSKCIILAVIALFGPAVAAGMEALSALLRGFVLGRMGLRKTLFNAAMLATAAAAAGVVYQALPFSDHFDGPAFLLPLTAALIAHSAINYVLVMSVLSLDTGVPFRSVSRRNYGWVQLRNVLDLPFAAMVILLYHQAGAWALVLFVFPVLALFQSDKLFLRIKEAHINSIAALTTALEADEPYTHGHSYRVAKYAVRIGRAMGMSDADLEVLEYGGLLHDIGKIAITNDIICKPGRLTDSEYAVMKTHPTIGADIVDQIRFLRDATDLVRHHHERPDGKGYPHGLHNGEISLGCHILNACDAFDAMTSDRPYRKALSPEKALEELVSYRGTQFDVTVVDTVVKLFAEGEFESLQDMPLPTFRQELVTGRAS